MKISEDYIFSKCAERDNVLREVTEELYILGIKYNVCNVWPYMQSKLKWD